MKTTANKLQRKWDPETDPMEDTLLEVAQLNSVEDLHTLEIEEEDIYGSCEYEREDKDWVGCWTLSNSLEELDPNKETDLESFEAKYLAGDRGAIMIEPIFLVKRVSDGKVFAPQLYFF